MYKLIISTSLIVMLGGCINMTEPAKTKQLNKENSSTQILPPKYLSIDGFKACLKTQTKGSASFYCMPDSKPIQCSDKAWEELNKLEDSEKITKCETNN